MNVRMRRFHGPSAHAPFAAVVAEFTNPFRDELLPASVIESQWRLLGDEPLFDEPAPSAPLSLEGLATALAIKLQHPADPENANVRIGVAAGAEASSIALGFTDAAASATVLQLAIELAEGVFRGAVGEVNGPERLAPRWQEVNATLRQWTKPLSR